MNILFIRTFSNLKTKNFLLYFIIRSKYLVISFYIDLETIHSSPLICDLQTGQPSNINFELLALNKIASSKHIWQKV